MRLRWIAVLVGGMLVLAACSSPSGSATPSAAPSTSEATPSPAETPAAPSSAAAGGESISVFDIQQGDCISIPSGETVETVDRVDCEAAHDYEVFALVNVPGDTAAAYPGDEQMTASAEQECPAAFEPFVGKAYDQSELYVYYLTPSSTTWADGDREIVCALYLPGEQLTGSMEGSGR